MKRNLFIILLTFSLLGCESTGGWFGGDDIDKDRIKGDRISILNLKRTLSADPQTQENRMILPEPYSNLSWPYPGGSLNNALQNLKGPTSLKQTWSSNLGSGSNKKSFLISTPIIAENKIFFLSTDSKLSAFNLKSRRKIWQQDLSVKKENKNEGFGGGMSFNNGVLYVSTGFGFIIAFESDSGEEIWRVNLRIPSRSAPIADDRMVYAITHDNQLFALDKISGNIMWTHRGILESATILSSTSVAVSDDLVFVPYSSGEIYAIRPINGSVIWTDSLALTGLSTSLSEINSITARPIIDNGRLISVSHAGRMVSIDIPTGERVWTLDLSSTETPWVSGDWLFLVTTNSEIVCVSRRAGKIRWVTQMQRFQNEEKKKNPIHWSGPIMISGKLLIVSSKGEAIWISPEDGEVVNRSKISGSAFLSPIVVNNTIYILNDKGELSAYN